MGGVIIQSFSSVVDYSKLSLNEVSLNLPGAPIFHNSDHFMIFFFLLILSNYLIFFTSYHLLHLFSSTQPHPPLTDKSE